MSARFEITGSSIAIVTLDWPERRNALGPDEARDLRQVIETSVRSADVQGLVLTGNGAFCAGGDLAAISALAADPDVDLAGVIYQEFQGLVRTLLELPVATAAAIDGAAVGLGFDLTLACDMRYFGAKGWVSQGWARMGLIPGTGGIRLLQHVAPGLLWKLLTEQSSIHGDEAETLGLGQAVPDKSAVPAAVEALASLGQMGQDALRAYARLSRQSILRDFSTHLQDCAETQGHLLRGDVFTSKARELLA
jgi:enoyl-CoA hydratase/carnithine racemase